MTAAPRGRRLTNCERGCAWAPAPEAIDADSDWLRALPCPTSFSARKAQQRMRSESAAAGMNKEGIRGIAAFARLHWPFLLPAAFAGTVYRAWLAPGLIIGDDQFRFSSD